MTAPTLEQMLCGERFFALTTRTPVQLAIARAADGRALGDELASDPRVVAAFGGAVAGLPVGVIPERVDVYSGIRTAKSLIASAAAVCMSQRIDVSMVRPGEMPRIPILSLDRDKADVVFQHIVGTIMSRPLLRGLLIGEPTSESIVLRHPTGVHVEIAPVAGKRAGGALVSRWLGGVIFDEAPRMLGSEDGAVVNIDDALDASAGRILPGGQTWVIGSPWAPWGECFNSVRDFLGKPSRSRVVVKAPAYDMNPSWWTPARVSALLASNPRAHKTDVEAEFADATASAIPSDWVDRAFRPLPRFLPLGAPIGVLDSSAGRGDSFVWSVARWCVTNPDREYVGETVLEGGFRLRVHRLDSAGRRIPSPSQPKPELFMLIDGWDALDGRFRESASFDEIVERVARHWLALGCTRAIGDQYQSWPLESGMARYGIRYRSVAWGQSNKTEALALVRNWFRDDQIRLDAGPQAAKVRAELVQLQVKPASGGGETIGARRGGHDDRAALVLNAAMLDSLGEFRGSPVERTSGVVAYDATGRVISYTGGARPPL